MSDVSPATSKGRESLHDAFQPFKYAVRTCKGCGHQDFGRQGMRCEGCGERYLWSAPVQEIQEVANG